MHPAIAPWACAILLAGAAVACEETRPPSTGSDEASFVGAVGCASCHPDETAKWLRSDHRLAMQVASDSTVRGRPADVQFAAASVRANFRRAGGKFLAETDSMDGNRATFEVVYTLGADPLQQYLVGLSRGRYQALRIAWDTRPREQGGQRWFDLYPGERIDHDDVLHWTAPPQNWNFMCAECHSTNVRKNYSAEDDSYRTEWSEVSVSCEACHGPASHHVTWARTAQGAGADQDSTRGLAVSLRNTGQWQHAAGVTTATRSVVPSSRSEVETCGRCHSRRSQVWPEYRYGRPLAETHRVDLLDEGLYAADGQQLGEVYEYGSFLQSRMYAAGVTCANCHDPHSGRLKLDGNALCTQCHSAQVFDTSEHHLHNRETEAAQCTSCHMPARAFMVIDRRRDHRFHVPRPDESARFGTPDVCTACHTGRSTDWASGILEVAASSKQQAARGKSVPVDRRSFTEAIALGRARRPEAAALLAELVRDSSMPEIARATALALFARYPDTELARVIERAAEDAEPIVRRAAAAVLPRLQPEVRAGVGVRLLSDSMRTVRLEAVLPMAALSREVLGVAGVHALARASEEFMLAQRFNAERPEARVNLGSLEVLLGTASAAEDAFASAVRLGPHFAPGYVALAGMHQAAGREAEVERTLRGGLARLPQAADLHHALGLALVRQKRLAEALVVLQRAAQLAPADPRNVFAYAVALHDSGDHTRALAVLGDAAARFPADVAIARALVAYRGEQPGARPRP